MQRNDCETSTKIQTRTQGSVAQTDPLFLRTHKLGAPTHACTHTDARKHTPQCIVSPPDLNHLQAQSIPALSLSQKKPYYSSFVWLERDLSSGPFTFFHYSPVNTQACQRDSMIHTSLTLIVFGRNCYSGWHSGVGVARLGSGKWDCLCTWWSVPKHITVSWWKPPQIFAMFVF